MSAGDVGMGLGLKALRHLAGLGVIDRVGLRGPAERALFRASRTGFRGAAAASRTFAPRRGWRARHARRPPAGATCSTSRPTTSSR